MNWTSPKFLGIVLLASVGLNLFFGGLMIGRVIDHPWHRDRGGMHERSPALHKMAPRWIGRVLSEETAEQLKPIWEKRESLIKPRAKALKEARKSVRSIMGEDPFDPQAYRAALKQVRERRSIMEMEIHEAMIETVAALNAEDRRKISEYRPRHRRFHKDRRLD